MKVVKGPVQLLTEPLSLLQGVTCHTGSHLHLVTRVAA